MTTSIELSNRLRRSVVEAYRLDRYDNLKWLRKNQSRFVVEAYRLDRYDNFGFLLPRYTPRGVVEAYRLDRYDNQKEREAIPTPLKL